MKSRWSIKGDPLGFGLVGLLLTVCGVAVSLCFDRTVAHTLGMAGVTLIFLACCQANSKIEQWKLSRLVGALAGLSFITVTASWKGLLGPDQAAFLLYLLVLIGPAIWFARNVLQKLPQRFPFTCAAGASIMISLVWELWYQPLVTVYGAAPRGWVQWDQVAADMAGVVEALLIAVLYSRLSLPRAIRWPLRLMHSDKANDWSGRSLSQP
mgnify:CR=1 FL=1